MTSTPATESLPDDLRAHAQRLADATDTSLRELLADATSSQVPATAIAVGWSEVLETGHDR